MMIVSSFQPARRALLGTLLLGALIQTAHAQESLAGAGAATAAGATLGAAAGTSITAGGATRGRGGAPGPGMNEGEEMDAGAPGTTTTTTTATTTTSVAAPIVQSFGLDARRAVDQLVGPATRPQPARVQRSPRAQSRYVRRVARLAPQTRTRIVTQKYRIPPVGWRGSYLPQDRYKFGKVWRYVSTEDSTLYFRPQDMARRRFNANRVIGFRTWQDAMLAGYRPDPISRPEPGAQIAELARLTRRPYLYRFVEYVYSGQVAPERFNATYNYARQVAASLNRTPYARPYISGTVDRVLQAAIEGNPGIIPRTIGGTRTVTTTVSTGTAPPMGQAPQFPGSPQNSEQ